MIGIIVFLTVLVVLMTAFIGYTLGWLGGVIQDEVEVKYKEHRDFVDGEIVDVR